MTEQDVLDLINAWIVANGNNEITADVLRPILIAILQQPNDLIGDLSTLNTTDQSNLVAAINEIYGSINNVGIQLYEGLNDPNDTPPPSYNIADFYIQKDILNNPIQLFQYNGYVWKRVGDIYATSTAYEETRFDYVASNSFTIPDNVQPIIVKKNGNPTESNVDWNFLGNTVTYLGTMVAGDFLLISGIYVNESTITPPSATTFLELTDVLASTYVGQAGKFPKVNAGETGLEFSDVPSGGAVDSVNGKTGVVVLDTSDIAENTNLYFTNTRVVNTIQSTSFVEVHSANKTLSPLENQKTIFMDSGTLTVNPSTQSYQNGFSIAAKSSGAANTPLVLSAATDWTYVINGAAPIASGSVFGEKGGTFTIIRKADLKIFSIDGSII